MERPGKPWDVCDAGTKSLYVLRSEGDWTSYVPRMYGEHERMGL